MEQQTLLSKLRLYYPELRTQFGVKSLALFGSCNRNEAVSGSDVDILVEFSQPIGFFRFLELKEALTERLGKQVDLVTKNGLHPALRDRILEEATYAE